MASGKEPKSVLTKEPQIILDVPGQQLDQLPKYIQDSLQHSIVENLGWSIYDLRDLEKEQAYGFTEWNSKRIQGCLAKHNTSILQLILVQQGHMYLELKKKVARAKLRVAEIDAAINAADHEAFVKVMLIFVEQLYSIAAIAFAFASTPLIATITPVVIGFAQTGFTLRDFVQTTDQEDQYINKRKEIIGELQKLENELRKDLWHDYIYPPETTETNMVEKSIRIKEEYGKNAAPQVNVGIKGGVIQQQAEEIRQLREEMKSLRAQVEAIRLQQLNK